MLWRLECASSAFTKVPCSNGSDLTRSLADHDAKAAQLTTQLSDTEARREEAEQALKTSGAWNRRLEQRQAQAERESEQAKREREEAKRQLVQ